MSIRYFHVRIWVKVRQDGEGIDAVCRREIWEISMEDVGSNERKGALSWPKDSLPDRNVLEIKSLFHSLILLGQ